MYHQGAHTANPSSSLKVIKFLLVETGTYNQQVRRPYAPTGRGEVANEILNRIAGAGGQSPLSRTNFMDLAGQFIAPTASWDKQIDIPNGWTEPRFRYILEIQRDVPGAGSWHELITGYSEYLDASYTGNIDPRMKLYVNSVSNTRTIQYNGQESQQLFRSSHILPPSDINPNQSIGVRTLTYDTRIRPQDLFTVADREHINMTHNGQMVLDGRNASARADKSSRLNNLPYDYMSRVFESFSRAETESQMGQRPEEVLNQARKLAFEVGSDKDIFLRTMAELNRRPMQNYFTVEELLTLDPYALHDSVCHIDFQDPQRWDAPQAHQFAHWTGTDIVTQSASVLAVAVPSMMMENAVMVMKFTASNRFIGQSEPSLIVSDMDSMFAINPFTADNMIRAGLVRGILPAISLNDEYDYDIRMEVDVIGDTVIEIEMLGLPRVRYCIPTFADALIAPVMTSDPMGARKISSEFVNLAQQAHEVAVHSSSQSSPIIQSASGGYGF